MGAMQCEAVHLPKHACSGSNSSISDLLVWFNAEPGGVDSLALPELECLFAPSSLGLLGFTVNRLVATSASCKVIVNVAVMVFKVLNHSHSAETP